MLCPCLVSLQQATQPAKEAKNSTAKSTAKAIEFQILEMRVHDIIHVKSKRFNN